MHHHLPEVFDVGDVTADQKGFEVLVDEVGDQLVPVGERRAAEAVKTRFAGFDLHDDEVDPLRRGADGTHVTNGYVAHV